VDEEVDATVDVGNSCLDLDDWEDIDVDVGDVVPNVVLSDVV